MIRILDPLSPVPRPLLSLSIASLPSALLLLVVLAGCAPSRPAPATPLPSGAPAEAAAGADGAGQPSFGPAPIPELVVVERDAGKVWNLFGLQIVGKVFSRDTGGAFAVIESRVPPGGGPPRHVHEHEDEMFYVLEGEFEFSSGDETARAGRGALVVLPRGLPHGFRNVGDRPGVLINTITPGGFEAFFEAVDRLPKDRPLDREQVEQIGESFGLTFVR